MATHDNNTLIKQETQEMMLRMNQSDTLLCNNINHLHIGHQQNSQQGYISIMSKPLAYHIRNVADEYTMWTNTYTDRVRTCTPDILKRGGNGVVPVLQQRLGNECLQTHPLIYKEKSCYISKHQPFDNMTRRI